MTLKKLGRYELLRVLGKGAMGVVYEGRDPNLDRRVAIKTVKVENLSEEAAAEYEHRFRTEARSAARLQHPNIVSVYDSDRDGDIAFLVMEYIQGDDLKHHLDRGVRYSLEQSLKIIRDLLSALDYAHKQGIVHRDIKPANLLIEPGGRVKLTDFGVARIQDSGDATRTQGSMVGTLKYMAPEQVQGQKVDSRADLFSVGVVLYQLLTDKRPFDGDNDFSIIHQIIGHHPAAPSTINARLPGALDAVVSRALAKTKEERFATARDFAVALQAAIRRAEDQTVLPPANPLKRVEQALSVPLSVPGTMPGGMTMPSSPSNVTQEVELVYWKDVKDSADAEDLHGFLEKFPTGIYADLARRRLRRMLGGPDTMIGAPGAASQPGFGSSQPAPLGTQPGFATSRPAPLGTQPGFSPSQPGSLPGFPQGLPPGTQPGYPPGAGTQPGQMTPAGYQSQPGFGTGTTFPDLEATRVRADTARTAAAERTEANLRPAEGSDEDYTQTVIEPRPDTEPAAPAAAAKRKSRDDDDTDTLIPPPKKKMPVPLLVAGIGAIAVVGIVLAVVGRGGDRNAVAPQPAASAPALAAPAASEPAATPPTSVATTPPADVASAPVAIAPASAPVAAAPASAPKVAAAGEAPKAATPRKAASQPRAVRAAPAAPEPPRTTTAMPTPRSEPTEPPSRQQAAVPPALATNGAYQAVDACRDRVFLAKELCLAEQCEKPAARNHPLCVKRRDDIRMREESKIRQGGQPPAP